jgi:hypothetical protein
MSMTRRPLLRFALLLPLLLLACAIVPAGATDLTYTGQKIVISEPGSYVLANDIMDNLQIIGIEIRASDVVLDGDGHLVDGRDSEHSTGIYVNGLSGAARNVTVKNITVRDWYYGVYVHETDDSAIESATL